MNFLVKVFKLVMTRGLGAASSIFVTVLVTRNYVDEEAGIILYSISLVMMFSQLLPLGSEMYLMRTVGANSEHRWSRINRLFSSITTLYLIVSFLLAFIAFLYALLSSSDPFGLKYGRYIPLITVVTGSFAGYIQFVSRGMIGLEKQGVATIFQTLLVPAIFILFFLVLSSIVKIDSISALLLYLAIYMAACIAAFLFWIRNEKTKIQIKITISSMDKSALRSFALITLITVTVQHSSSVLAGAFLSPSELASFNVCRRVSLLVSFILIAVNLLVAPKFAKAYSQNNLQVLNKIALKSGKLLFVIGISVFIFVVSFSDFILSVFGDSYINDREILIILMLGQTVNVLSGSVMFLLSMTNHEKDILKVSCTMAPVSIVLAITMAHFFGLIGIAIATSIVVACQNLLFVTMVQKRLGFNTLNIWRKL